MSILTLTVLTRIRGTFVKQYCTTITKPESDSSHVPVLANSDQNHLQSGQANMSNIP